MFARKKHWTNLYADSKTYWTAIFRRFSFLFFWLVIKDFVKEFMGLSVDLEKVFYDNMKKTVNFIKYNQNFYHFSMIKRVLLEKIIALSIQGIIRQKKKEKEESKKILKSLIDCKRNVCSIFY